MDRRVKPSDDAQGFDDNAQALGQRLMHIRAPKDFWSGIMFIAFAAVALIASRDYSLGTSLRMGPGYFPILLGCVLALIGLILVARAFAIEGDGVGRLHLMPLGTITLGVVLFGVLLVPLGLVISLILVVVLSAFASRESKPLEVAALALALAVFSAGLFVYGLRLPLPVWPAL